MPSVPGVTDNSEMTSFPPQWDDGTTADSAEHQVHWYDERTVIIRQALRTNFEGPFIYLLLGSERALLLDTGTGHADLRKVVDELLDGRDLELVVAHTHGHGDHVGGDNQFATPGSEGKEGKRRIRVVGKSAEEVAEYFGISAWPDEVVEFDLGDRVLDVVPIPGHHPSHLAFYDRSTQLLLTGDSLYPGRLYVFDWPAYRASIARLAAFVAAGKPVRLVLGTHIEMSQEPGVDFGFGSDRHPGEHQLQLAPEALTELAEALEQAGDTPRRIVRDDFIVFPLSPAGEPL
ncbi:glyoxylase-like metal-dependent hydrolase (beta-lactamase superfamily II) [Kribbella voronezhensis]|uniref:Glyoxylase-like metal-dependent hydrolase (Beta-lactamase superfamily II) n=1 Tax=Kribbella voronezhensis TaxID=2512212 RepID=A0A4R7SZN5_9ACTN|nr:glyoxylase-like metal-dependent hydrolase (beta-lactamase superfamily II) [Kribbella voronezhensis]